jgi:3-hydroxyacyl-CoA dehydrogenase
VGHSIKKVAVLGAGVMGQGIAAHLANAGIPSVLFDIVPRGVDEGASPAKRNKAALDGLKSIAKSKPAGLFHKSFSELITPANYDDHGHLLADCDWIVEVVVELLPIKRKVFQWVAENRKPGSIVSSNTSGISLADMAADMPQEMKERFLVTHFFNPVRYMRLLELVDGPDTLASVTQEMARFGETTLGKGIVYAKDTPNFIANRIGTYGICSVFKHLESFEMSVEEIDAIFGPPMGRPKSAVFNTGDIVGLDTLVHVLNNVYDSCVDDEERDVFKVPAWLQQMVDEGALGRKAKKGFYEMRREGGKKNLYARNLKTGEYAPKQKVRYASIGATRDLETPGEKIKAMLAGDDKAAQIAWAVTSDTLLYAANRIPEIADDVYNVDRGMRWGFGWDLGPFEGWDAAGVRSTVERMASDGRTVPAWVTDMLSAGRESFYETIDGVLTYWDLGTSAAKAVPQSESWLFLSDVHARTTPVYDGMSASLLDLGDGILGLEFHAKMNALDDDIIGAYVQALDLLDAGEWAGLVVGNQNGPAFCAGANLFMVAMASMQQQWDQLEQMIRTLQETVMRAKYSKAPVVTAPRGLVLGGGCEVAMHSAHTRALGETYIGLVEVGVGLLPAGGGCKEMLWRHLAHIPEGVDYDPNPFVQAAYKNIALAEVAKSVEEARAMGYIRPTDTVTMDADALIHDAKQVCLGLIAADYQPPRRTTIKVPGPSGRSAIEAFLYQMHQAGWATDHDVVVGKKVGHVMTGGDVPSNHWVTEQHILDLEREGFLSLCGEPNTLARIQHMLTTGKPLRN